MPYDGLGFILEVVDDFVDMYTQVTKLQTSQYKQLKADLDEINKRKKKSNSKKVYFENQKDIGNNSNGLFVRASFSATMK